LSMARKRSATTNKSTTNASTTANVEPTEDLQAAEKATTTQQADSVGVNEKQDDAMIVEDAQNTEQKGDAQNTEQKEAGTKKPVHIMGKPVSGRSWKVKEQKRFSTIKASEHKISLHNKMKEKERLVALKKYNAEVIAERKAQALVKRKSIEANKKRKAENVLKSTTVHVIKNPHKIKKMSRKRQKMFSKININELELTRIIR